MSIIRFLAIGAVVALIAAAAITVLSLTAPRIQASLPQRGENITERALELGSSSAGIENSTAPGAGVADSITRTGAAKATPTRQLTGKVGSSVRNPWLAHMHHEDQKYAEQDAMRAQAACAGLVNIHERTLCLRKR